MKNYIENEVILSNISNIEKSLKEIDEEIFKIKLEIENKKNYLNELKNRRNVTLGNYQALNFVKNNLHESDNNAPVEENNNSINTIDEDGIK